MIKQSADEQTAFVYYGLCDKSEFVGIMHNAKCIMHNYMFLFVGAAIGSPFVIQTNFVGRVALNPPIAECNGAITVVHRSIAINSMNQFVHSAEIRDFRFVFDKCGPMWASVPTLGSNIPTNSAFLQNKKAKYHNNTLLFILLKISPTEKIGV